MRKIILFTLLFCFCKIAAGQYPITQNLGNANTLVQVPSPGALRGSLINRVATDTTAANLSPIDAYAGAMIATTTGGIKLWIRNEDATAWVQMASGSSVGTVTSVGLSMPSAFSVANSPITGAGTLAVTGAGTTSQYIRGDGSLATYTGISSVTNKGFERATLASGVLNIPKDERVGLYLTLGKTYARYKPLIYAGTIITMGNSWANGCCGATGTFWGTQLGTYYNKTVSTASTVLGGDLNTLVNTSYPFGTFGNDTASFVDVTFAPAWGFCTSGQPGAFFIYNDHPNDPQVTKTKNYIYGTYKAFLANYYLDNDWFSVASLADPNFRDAVASDSLGTKSTPGSIGLGAFSFTKPAGKTSLVIGTYGADSTRVRQGTVTVELGATTYFSQYLNGLNDGNKGNALVIKCGLNYYAIVLQNLPPEAATVTVTASGDSTRFDYIGYLKPKETAVRPLYINNIGYGSASGGWIIPLNLIDTANQMLQDAVNDFIDYPVFIQNTNNWFDSTIHNNGTFHLTGAGQDSIAKAYIANLIPQGYAPTKSNIATSTPISSLTAALANNSVSGASRAYSFSLVDFSNITFQAGSGDPGNEIQLSSSNNIEIVANNGNINLTSVSDGIFLKSSTFGSNGANGDLRIRGTSHATKTTSYVTLQEDGGNVGIGTSTPTSLAHINGVLQLGTATSTLGQLLMSGNTSGTATIVPPAAAGTPTLTLPTVTGTFVQYATTTEASNATPTPTGDAKENNYALTALATDPTFAAPSGTPTNFNTLLIRIKDNSTVRALSWNAIYRAGTDIALPTTTVDDKTMYLYFVYNSTDSVWDFVGYTANF